MNPSPLLSFSGMLWYAPTGGGTLWLRPDFIILVNGDLFEEWVPDVPAPVPDAVHGPLEPPVRPKLSGLVWERLPPMLVALSKAGKSRLMVGPQDAMIAVFISTTDQIAANGFSQDTSSALAIT